MNKKEIEKLLVRFLKVNEEKLRYQKEEKDIKAKLKKMFSKDKSKPETITGITTKVDKVPVNKGKNNYDATLLKPFLNAIDEYDNIIEEVPTIKYNINIKKLEELVKNGRLPQEVLDLARQDKWSTKLLPSRIEKNMNNKETQVS